MLKSEGIQIVMPVSGQTVCYWPYCQIQMFKHLEQSEDDEDMELLVFDVIGVGEVIFEVENTGITI